MASLRCLLQHLVLFFLPVLQHSPTRCLEIRESFLLLEIITLQLPPSWEPHTPGPYSSIAFGFPSIYDVGLGSCPSRICWVCFSPIWLSWCYTVCSSSHPIGETNITTSPCYTDKNPEDSHIRSFNWISRQVTRSLMCQKWLFRNQQTVSCCVSLPSLCWLAVLYSLENHFWAAQTCLSMLIALLLFAHTILRALGWWHTLCDIHFLARSG